jgi:outer membrane protein assembly factor BamB
VTVLVTATVQAAERPLVWPQFRGPGGSGVAEGQRPPVEFGPEKNVKWKVAVPPGLSSPIVVGELLVLTAFEDDKLYTIAYRRADGGEAWRAEAPAEKIEAYLKGEGSPAASTPATDGQRIVSYFGSCGLLCYDLQGHDLWRYQLPPATTMANFGSGVSPVIADGTVVLLRDVAKGAKILAVDLDTGALKWERERQSPTGFCTPVVWDTPQGKQVAAPGFSKMIGYDLETGEERWFVDGMPSAICASPVTSGGELFFAAWSPGDPAETEFKMPTFDEVLKGPGGDTDGDGAVSKQEAQTGAFKDFFDANDTNQDGFLKRDEWDQTLAFMAASKNSAFALPPGGAGDVTSRIRWKQTKGLPYVASAIVYAGQHVMVKDGGIVTAYDAQTGDQVYQKRAVAPGSYYASPVAAAENIYFVALADGAVTVLRGGAPAPEVVAENPPLGERVAATPAVADDTLYVRTAGHLYAFANGR